MRTEDRADRPLPSSAASSPPPAPAGRALRDGLRQRVRRALSAALPGFTASSRERADGRTPRGLVVAFSGGLDSTALLRLVLDAAARRNGRRPEVVAAHLDHGLREDSAAQARFAEAAAGALGVPFVLGRQAVASRAGREGTSLEAAGRSARAEFLAETARDRGLSAVALGHTRNDQAETVLLQLLRGAGGLGLAAMPPAREDPRGVLVVRPLLGVSREELAALGAAEGWEHYEDPSNESPDFTRNRLRREVLPLLRRTANPSVVEALARAAELLREDEAWLTEAASAWWRREGAFREERGGRTARAPAAKLREAAPALRRRIAREAFRFVRGDLRRIGFAQVEEALAIVRAGRGGAKCELPGAGVRLARGEVVFTERREAGPAPNRTNRNDPVESEEG